MFIIEITIISSKDLPILSRTEIMSSTFYPLSFVVVKMHVFSSIDDIIADFCIFGI